MAQNENRPEARIAARVRRVNDLREKFKQFDGDDQRTLNAALEHYLNAISIGVFNLSPREVPLETEATRNMLTALEGI